jgi:hypothetical protein
MDDGYLDLSMTQIKLLLGAYYSPQIKKIKLLSKNTKTTVKEQQNYCQRTIKLLSKNINATVKYH